MEHAFTASLQKFFPAKMTEKNDSHPRAEFYAKYKQEAENADKEKYEEDLNTTLIFVCPPIYSPLLN